MTQVRNIPAVAQIQNAMRDAATIFLTSRKNARPRVSADGGAAETLPTKRGTVRFAVTAGAFQPLTVRSLRVSSDR